MCRAAFGVGRRKATFALRVQRLNGRLGTRAACSRKALDGRSSLPTARRSDQQRSASFFYRRKAESSVPDYHLPLSHVAQPVLPAEPCLAAYPPSANSSASSARQQRTSRPGSSATRSCPLLAAAWQGDGAAAGQIAPRRQTHRTGDLALQPDRQRMIRPPRRVGVQMRGQQRPRVGKARTTKNLVAVALLDDLAQIHHRHPMAQMPNRRQVVGDEQVGGFRPR